MIHKKLENLINEMREVKLSSNEKSEILNRTLLVIDALERAHISLPVKRAPIKSIFVTFWDTYIVERKFMPTMALIAILLVTGGTSLAAENALPGDSLYPMKINVNEQIQALAATTPEAKAKFAAESTSQRLKEAAILSNRGQLDAGKQQIIEKQIAKNAGEIKNQVASLASKNNLKAAQSLTVNFESSLKAHTLILEKLSTDQASSTSTSTSASTTIGSLINTVKSELATTTASRVNFEAEEFRADSNNREKIEKDLVDVQADFVETQKLLKNSDISTSTASTSLVYFTKVVEHINTATKSINKAVYPEALTALQEAEKVLSDVRALITADISSNDTSDLKAVVQTAIAGAKPNPDLNLLSPSGTSTPATSTPVSVDGAASSTASTTVAA